MENSQLRFCSNSKWSMAKRIIHFIVVVFMYSICLIIILAFLAFVINFLDQRRNLSNGITKPPLFSAYTIVSPSMVPEIKVLDVVITKRVENKEHIKKGDIITFNSTDYRYSGITITHRVMQIEKTSDGKYLYTTKGDANNTNDSSRVSFDDIYGKVLLRVPKIGYIQYILSNVFGWIIIIILPTAGIIIYDIVKLIRTVKDDPVNKNVQKKDKRERIVSSKKKDDYSNERKRFK